MKIEKNTTQPWKWYKSSVSYILKRWNIVYSILTQCFLLHLLEIPNIPNIPRSYPPSPFLHILGGQCTIYTPVNVYPVGIRYAWDQRNRPQVGVYVYGAGDHKQGVAPSNYYCFFGSMFQQIPANSSILCIWSFWR